MTTIDPLTLKKLGCMSLFAGLKDEDVRELAQMAVEMTFESNETVVEESDKGDDVYAILKGRINISVAVPGSGRSEWIAEVKDGEILGESILLGKTRRIATAIAKDKVTALKWSHQDLTAHFDKNPHQGYLIMRNLARIVHERLIATNMNLRNAINRIVGIY